MTGREWRKKERRINMKGKGKLGRRGERREVKGRRRRRGKKRKDLGDGKRKKD